MLPASTHSLSSTCAGNVDEDDDRLGGARSAEILEALDARETKRERKMPTGFWRIKSWKRRGSSSMMAQCRMPGKNVGNFHQAPRSQWEASTLADHEREPIAAL